MTHQVRAVVYYVDHHNNSNTTEFPTFEKALSYCQRIGFNADIYRDKVRLGSYRENGGWWPSGEAI